MRLIFLPIVLMILNACSGKSGIELTNLSRETTVIEHERASRIQANVAAFIYHRIGDNRYPSTNTTEKEFEGHLKYLSDHNYQVKTVSDALNSGYSDSTNRKNIICLTIDDAFLSFYENGFPLLKKYGFTATLFVNTETVGGNTYMNWEQINEVMDYGIEIGNHSHSHAYFLNYSDDIRSKLFKDDLLLSQRLFEEHIQRIPSLFAYPYGEYDAELKQIVESLGFKSGMAQNSGIIHKNSDLFSLPRFPMATAYASIDRFREKVNMNPLIVNYKMNEENVILNSFLSPELTVEFSTKDFNLSQLQCFIQNRNCVLEILDEVNYLASIKIAPDKPLNSRRTLYTLTIPDKNGKWYWFSHLWINPSIK